jgi:type II secretory pathway component PulM
MFLRILGCDIIGVVVKYYLVYWKPLYMDVSFTRQYFQDDMSGLEHESMIP